MEALRPVVRVPVVAWDERFTSVDGHAGAERGRGSARERKASVDKVAAMLILQSYLDYRRLADAEARASA